MPTPLPESLTHSLSAVVDAAIERACRQNASLYVGRCTEASIIVYGALKVAGYDKVVMRCGEWHGPMDQTARDYFRVGGTDEPAKHSWTEVFVDAYGWVVVDPTQWIFEFESRDPDCYIGSASDDERYQLPRNASFSARDWMDSYLEWLRGCGFDTTGLPGD